MRLIDADKIYQILENKSSYGYVSALDISSIEIVKAIPIEWIKSKIDAILDSYPDGNEETEILCKLLYEREKENEREIDKH